MNENLIRSIIFLIAGLIVIFFPRHVNTFQNSALKIINKKIPYEIKNYYTIGAFFFIISIILFIFSFYSEV